MSHFLLHTFDQIFTHSHTRSGFGGLQVVAEGLQYEYKIKKGGQSELNKHPPMVKLVSQR